MSNFTPLDEQYPNQLLGVAAKSDTNVGAVNLLEAPMLFATHSGATGSIFNSGTGSPGLTGATNRIAGNTGDFYFRAGASGTTSIYKCISSGPATSSGGATGAVWQEVV